jgi:hypothetical protein
MIVNLLVGAAAANYLLLSRNARQIAYRKACVVQLAYSVIGIVLVLIIGFIFALGFGAAIFGRD